MDLTQRLLYARKVHAKLTQKELIIKINELYNELGLEPTTQGSYSRVESGKSMSFKHLAAVARVTGVRMDWLAFGIGPITHDPEWDQFSADLGTDKKKKIMDLFAKKE